MTAKVIARLLCGECTGNRHVMAKLVDTPNGAALRASDRRRRFEDMPVRDMPTLEQRPAWFGVSDPPPIAEVGCPRHGWVAVTSEYLRDVEARYRQTGQVVTRILDHPRS